MYAYFIGEVNDIDGDNLIFEVNQIGYNIKIASRTAEYLSRYSGEVKIYTYTSVREDAFLLYGFLTKEELVMFKKLIMVNGVGPKGALAILDLFNVRELQLAIISQDAKTIAKANGVGNKTAERIIIDLKDKIDIDQVIPDYQGDTADRSSENPQEKDALEALVSLGYSVSEAVKAIKSCHIEDTDQSDDILKKALKKI